MNNVISDAMIIFLTDDGVSLQIDGQCAGYHHNGCMHVFSGTDKNKLPKTIVLHDRRGIKANSTDTHP